MGFLDTLRFQRRGPLEYEIVGWVNRKCKLHWKLDEKRMVFKERGRTGYVDRETKLKYSQTGFLIVELQGPLPVKDFEEVSAKVIAVFPATGYKTEEQISEPDYSFGWKLKEQGL